MTTQTPDTQALLERLEKLERQNRWLKRLAIPALVAVAGLATVALPLPQWGSVGVIAIAAVVLLLLIRERVPRDSVAVPSEFVVKDANGNVRVKLGLGDRGAFLLLQDPEENALTLLSAGSLSLIAGDVDETIVGMIDAHPEGGSILHFHRNTRDALIARAFPFIM
jgi:hypothetical protein